MTGIGTLWKTAFVALLLGCSPAIAQGVTLSELPLDTLKAFSPTIGEDVYPVLTLQGSLNARNGLGGTAPAQVHAQVARHRARLG